jgi:hypothetical protein
MPDLTPVPGAYFDAIPQRYPYPEIEKSINEDNVPYVRSILVPVWWAAD